jgi:hypothetical protein
MQNVQAIINNISFPKTVDGLKYYVQEVEHFNIEDVFSFSVVKWGLTNDIVFFLP